MADPNLNQHTYGFFEDDSSDPDTCTIIGSIDSTSEEWALDTNLMVRIGLDEDASKSSAGTTFRLEWSLTEGSGYAYVIAASSGVKVVSGTPTDGTVCDTRILTAGTGTFTDGVYDDGDGITGSVIFDKGEYFELQWCVQILSADITPPDVIYFRVFRVGGDAATLTYAASAQITAIAAGGDETLTAEPDSFAVTVAPASLEQGYEVVATTDSFAVTGSAAALEQGYEVGAGVGSYACAGTDITFPRTYILPAGVDSFAATATDANLEQGYRLDAATDAFAITGTAASLERGYPLDAEPAAFAVTATAADLKWGHRLDAETDSLTTTGTDATFALGISLSAEPDSYALTGTAASLEQGYRVDAATDSYTVAGQDVTLTKVGSETMEAVAGAFAVTGTAATLVQSIIMAGGVDSFVTTGTAASLEQGYRLDAGSAALVAAGSDAGLDYFATPSRHFILKIGQNDFRLSMVAGSFAYTGSVVGLTVVPISSLEMEPSSFVVTGTDLSFGDPFRFDDFETGDKGYDEGGFFWSEGAGVVNSDRAYGGSTYSMEGASTYGTSWSSTENRFNMGADIVDEMWFEGQWWVPADYEHGTTSNNKWLAFWNDQGYNDADIRIIYFTTLNSISQPGDGRLYVLRGKPDNGVGSQVDVFIDDSMRGQWNRIQVHCKFASSAVAEDGIVQLRVNDSTIMSATDVLLWHTTEAKRVWRRGWVGGYNTAGFITSPAVFAWDNFKLFDSDPGWSF